MTSSQILIPTLLALSAGLLFAMSEDGQIRHPSLPAKARRKVGASRDTTRVRARLTQLGREGQFESFRTRQLVIASSAGALAIFLVMVLASSPLISLISAPLFSFGAYVYVDRSLTKDVKNRLLALESEFAPVVEMLTLSLSAGQTPVSSMSRIAERSTGFLGAEFGRVVDEVRSGSPFNTALDAMGARSESMMIRRFVDALITAMMRGAPLVDVLQRHALEARANQRNTLLTVAGKAEISMMIPVVFLILPISVLFALWPSVTNLNLFAT